MAEHIRKYPEAPTAQEIKQGYAPSTIRRTPFVKFLFWTFVGLVICYGIGYATQVGLSEMQAREDTAAYGHLPIRREAVFVGPALQPSKGHDRIDWLDTQIMYGDHEKELRSKGWTAAPTKLWKVDISPQVIAKTEAALKKQAKMMATQPAATQPAADIR